jgi:hypothetical protein
VIIAKVDQYLYCQSVLNYLSISYLLNIKDN